MNKKLKPLLSSEKMDWGTPQEFFDGMEKLFGKFDLDAACNDANQKCDEGYAFDVGLDGLKLPWCGKRQACLPDNPLVWLNPPYGRQLPKWIDKAIEESKKGATVVVLVPARTDTKWFRKCWDNASEIYFVQGRLKFEGAPTSAPFPSMVVKFGGDYEGVPQFCLLNTKGEVIG